MNDRHVVFEMYYFLALIQYIHERNGMYIKVQSRLQLIVISLRDLKNADMLCAETLQPACQF